MSDELKRAVASGAKTDVDPRMLALQNGMIDAEEIRDDRDGTGPELIRRRST